MLRPAFLPSRRMYWNHLGVATAIRSQVQEAIVGRGTDEADTSLRVRWSGDNRAVTSTLDGWESQVCNYAGQQEKMGRVSAPGQARWLDPPRKG